MPKNIKIVVIVLIIAVLIFMFINYFTGFTLFISKKTVYFGRVLDRDNRQSIYTITGKGYLLQEPPDYPLITEMECYTRTNDNFNKCKHVGTYFYFIDKFNLKKTLCPYVGESGDFVEHDDTCSVAVI